MAIRGIRGATVIEEDREELVLSATRDLLLAIQEANPTLRVEELASIFFTVSEDISSTYPALAARQLGWLDVPLLCTNEIPVQDSLPLCVRILVNWNTPIAQKDIVHIYIKEAIQLRPDLCKLPPVDFDELESWIAEYMASMDEPPPQD